MKSLERCFQNIAKRNPGWSSYLQFAEAIKNQKFSKEVVHRWFTKLVDKDDYDRKDKRAILAQLTELANSPEDDRN